jgi:uncharacterized Zn finger protein (UPF0148 family)
MKSRRFCPQCGGGEEEDEEGKERERERERKEVREIIRSLCASK